MKNDLKMYLLSSRKLQNSIILLIRGILKSFKDNLKYDFLPKKSIKTTIHKIEYVNSVKRLEQKCPPEGTFVKTSLKGLRDLNRL